jgi:hypothetical protein
MVRPEADAAFTPIKAHSKQSTLASNMNRIFYLRRYVVVTVTTF